MQQQDGIELRTLQDGIELQDNEQQLQNQNQVTPQSFVRKNRNKIVAGTIAVIVLGVLYVLRSMTNQKTNLNNVLQNNITDFNKINQNKSEEKKINQNKSEEKKINTTIPSMQFYIDPNNIDEISQYGSNWGHSYGTGNTSDKHYFVPNENIDWSKVEIKAPINGTIVKIEKEQLEDSGYQITIQSKENPDTIINIFHVNLKDGIKVGTKLKTGDLLGNHTGNKTYSDIAIWNNGETSSYIENLSEKAFKELLELFIQGPNQNLVKRDKTQQFNETKFNYTKQDLKNLQNNYCCIKHNNNIFQPTNNNNKKNKQI